jgi:hypothetical protein
MSGRTTYRTLSPKRAPFQIGVDWWSHLRKVPGRRRISHTHPVCLWGCSPCKISLPGPIFYGTKWLLWRPHIQSPPLHSRCGINKGLIKRGSKIDHWRSRCKGWILWPTPYLYIHTYTNYHIYLIIALCGQKMSLNLHEVVVQPITCEVALRAVLYAWMYKQVIN